MKQLIDLQRQALLATRFYDLICIAIYSDYPSTAYKAASGLGWRDGQAASCRFLSIILRDYGQDEALNFIRDRNVETINRICICDCHLRQYSANDFFNLDLDHDCDCCEQNECFHAAHVFGYDCPNCYGEYECGNCSCDDCDGSSVCIECQFEINESCRGTCKCYKCDDGDHCSGCPNYQVSCDECSCQNCNGDACEGCEGDCEGCMCQDCTDRDHCENCDNYDPDNFQEGRNDEPTVTVEGLYEEIGRETRPDGSETVISVRVGTITTTVGTPESSEGRIQRICNRIQKAAGTDYPVRIIESNEVNAFADGESVSVTSAMLENLDDDELAWVMGHEVIHNLEEHPKKRAERTNEIFSNVTGILRGPHGVIRRTITAAAVGFINHATNCSRNRREELIADARAKRLAEKAGFNPRKAKSALSKFSHGRGRMFDEHPSREVRLYNVDED